MISIIEYERKRKEKTYWAQTMLSIVWAISDVAGAKEGGVWLLSQIIGVIIVVIVIVIDDAQPGNPNPNYKNGNEWYNTSQRKVVRWY